MELRGTPCLWGRLDRCGQWQGVPYRYKSNFKKIVNKKKNPKFQNVIQAHLAHFHQQYFIVLVCFSSINLDQGCNSVRAGSQVEPLALANSQPFHKTWALAAFLTTRFFKHGNSGAPSSSSPSATFESIYTN